MMRLKNYHIHCYKYKEVITYGKEQHITYLTQKDLQYVFDCNGDTKLRSDMSKQLDFSVETGTIQPAETAEESLTVQCFQFNTQKKKYALLEHHSCCIVKQGRCKWEKCPGCNRDDLTDRDRPVGGRAIPEDRNARPMRAFFLLLVEREENF